MPRDNTGPGMKAEGECRVRVAKDEKREIMDNEEEHYWRLLKYNGMDECLLKDSTWLLAE